MFCLEIFTAVIFAQACVKYTSIPPIITSTPLTACTAAQPHLVEDYHWMLMKTHSLPSAWMWIQVSKTVESTHFDGYHISVVDGHLHPKLVQLAYT